jgi:hypothetical protein
VTEGGDKGFDTAEFVRECRNMRVTPHVAQNLARRGGSAIDGRTTQRESYRISQKKRKRIEECFGWLKTIAPLRKGGASRNVEGRLDGYLRLRRLQSGAHAKPDGRYYSRAISWRRSVCARP